jgi:hypothetical protein
MNPLDQLHDIDGLDAISFWPLAPGWWAVLAAIVIFLAALLVYIIRRVRYRRSWQYDTWKTLIALEKNLTESTAKESLIKLSEYLRRIAIKRFHREKCAGLVGIAWLKWLTENDPKKFDWEKKGAILTALPYAPESSTIAAKEVKPLISAVKRWVK